MLKSLRGGAAVAAMMATTSGCGVFEGSMTPVPFTPEAPPSLEAEAEDKSSAVARAFLARMHDPGVTYRVSGEFELGPWDSGGQPFALVRSAYDVSGADYAGTVTLGGVGLDSGRQIQSMVVDGSSHWLDWSAVPSEWSPEELPDTARRANPFVEFGESDLTFMGFTDDGLHEFDVPAWIGGDPFSEWAAVGALGAGTDSAMTVTSHRTRLTVDADGIPQRLTSSWTFSGGPNGSSGEGSLVDTYSAFGLYVAIAAPEPADGLYGATSHDIIIGVDADHVAQVEPWFELEPPRDASAPLEVTFVDPGQPLMLGVEGAIPFVRTDALDGSLATDQILTFQGGTAALPLGENRIVAYYRTCDGNCRILDPPHEFCAVETEVVEGLRYELSVRVLDTDRAECDLRDVSP